VGTTTWVKAVAGFRIVIGVGCVVAPSAWSRPWVGAAVDTPVARLVVRTFGIREVVMGLGALSARDDEETARWLRLGSIADAVDGLAVLAAWPHLPRVARYADAAMAAGAAAANARTAQALVEESQLRSQ
jgi:hypothetical protein